MERRRIGDLEVTVVGLGCNNFGWRLDEERSHAVVHACLDAGVNFFDTADVYGDTVSEEYLGRALAGSRDEVVIATKFGFPLGDDPNRRGASARWVATAVEESLRRLGTDRIDLYQLHVLDPGTPIEETLEALDRLVRAGKVREIGHSNFDAAHLMDADDVARARGLSRFVSAQNELSLLRRRALDDLVPAVSERGLALLPYLPLANGLLTGKYHRGQQPPDATRVGKMPPDRAAKLLSDSNFDVVEALEAFAQERDHTILELALAWLLALPPLASVIAGASNREQVQANVAAAGWILSAEDREQLDKLLTAL